MNTKRVSKNNIIATFMLVMYCFLFGLSSYFHQHSNEDFFGKNPLEKKIEKTNEQDHCLSCHFILNSFGEEPLHFSIFIIENKSFTYDFPFQNTLHFQEVFLSQYLRGPPFLV